MNVLFIGGGNMATAIIGGLYRQPGTTISVVEHSEEKRDALAAKYGVTALSALPAALSADDVIVLAVKPQNLKAVCTELAPRLNGALLVSIAAGVDIATLSRWSGGTTRIVRVMPNTPALVGKGVSGLYAAADVAVADRNAAEAIMTAVGRVLWVGTESGIDDVIAVSGSGPAYVFHFVEALEAVGRDVGFDAETARQLALETLEGASALRRDSGEPAGELKRKVMSKGGTTERAIASFEDDRVKEAIVRGALACRARAVEMSADFSRS